MDKKGQTGGLITGLVFGIASLVIGVIIAFVIVSTLTGADLLTQSRTTTTTTNETNAWINTTGYTLSNFDSDTSVGAALTEIWAVDSGVYNISVPLTNASLDTSTGVVTNATVTTYANVSLSYTITTESSEEAAADRLNTNFTEGVDNVSEQIPTVLLIAAIVLILAVLAILVGVWQRMRMGGGEGVSL